MQMDPAPANTGNGKWAPDDRQGQRKRLGSLKVTARAELCNSFYCTSCNAVASILLKYVKKKKIDSILQKNI